MKEIIYIQAGNYSNFTGSHFWNTQDAYLAGENADPAYDWNVSFREDPSSGGRRILHPRLLIFDYEANFGALARSDASSGRAENEKDYAHAENLPEIWSQETTQYKSEAIQRPSSHRGPIESQNSKNFKHTPVMASPLPEVRYWSDFSRVSHVPRTIQKLPDPTSWEIPEGDWRLGKSMFSQYDEDRTLMEGDLRLFLEECDSPQGLHVINDTPTFGGFIDAFLTSFRDHYDKLPYLVFPILSGAVSQESQAKDYIGMRKVVNDALYLRNLNEMALLNIPIQPASVWFGMTRLRDPTIDDPYHTSAVLSALVETTTLSLRFNTSKDDLVMMAARLNRRGTTRFCELAGIFPFTSPEDFDTRVASFSATRVERDGAKYTQFTRLDTTRGFTPSGISVYEQWSAGQPLQDAFISRIHATPYPVPTALPLLFGNAIGNLPRKGILSNVTYCSVFSSLSTSSSTAQLFSSYASTIDAYLKRRTGLAELGFDTDELKDLVNDLWSLHDNFEDGYGNQEE